VGRNEIEGQEDGIAVGDLVAVPGLRMVGAIVGTFGVTGKKVGTRVGQEEGRNVGRVVGDTVGADGFTVGVVDGEGVGLKEIVGL
jgi:hypothetical protein